MACLPPLVTSTWLGTISKPESRLVLDTIASLSRQSTRRRVAMITGVFPSGNCGLDNGRRRREVRFPGPEADNVDPLRFQLLGLGIDSQGGRGRHAAHEIGGVTPTISQMEVVSSSAYACTSCPTAIPQAPRLCRGKRGEAASEDPPTCPEVHLTALVIPQHLLPSDGRFGSGPSKVRTNR